MRTVATATFDDLTMIGSWLCESDRVELAATRDPDDYVSLAKDAMKGKHRYVVLDDARPVMAFGAIRSGPGAVVVWGFKTERGWPAVPLATRYIKSTMIPSLLDAGFKRANCLVHSCNQASIKWLVHMGFTPKASMVGVGAHGEDMLLYEWLANAQRQRHA